jgi:truncated hemoglobin YjbI
VSAPEPSDDELVAFAESLLQNVGPHLRERHVLEEAIRHHRPTWLSLYEAAQALKGIGAPADPSSAA